MKQDNLKIALGLAESCPKGHRLSGVVTGRGITLSPLIKMGDQKKTEKRWPLYLPLSTLLLSSLSLGGSLANLSLSFIVISMLAVANSLSAITLARRANRPAYSVDEDTHRWFWNNVKWSLLFSAASSWLSALIILRLAS